MLPASFLDGMAGGSLWALCPGLSQAPLKGTDEVITTLMGNFIAALVLVYVASGPLNRRVRHRTSRPPRSMLPALYRISDSQGISPSHHRYLQRRSRSPCGCWSTARPSACSRASPGAIRPWCGLRERSSGRWVFRALLISGALAGLAGTIELLGPTGRIASELSMPGHGFTAVADRAGRQPLGAQRRRSSAFSLAALSTPRSICRSWPAYPAAAIDIFNASVALFITAKSALRGAAFLLRSQAAHTTEFHELMVAILRSGTPLVYVTDVRRASRSARASGTSASKA